MNFYVNSKIEYQHTCLFFTLKGLIKTMAASEIYLASIGCQAKLASGKRKGESCSNTASYSALGGYYCGTHSKKDESRTKLNKNPNAKAEREEDLERYFKEIKVNADTRKSIDGHGSLACYKMRMMKSVPLDSNYLNVFPNFKHGGRKDGIGCSTLSPMSIGPIDHGQPGLPPALNLENLHQGNKEFLKLCKLFYEEGYNLNICGYDGFKIEWKTDVPPGDMMDKLYYDTSRPFGHELVLYAMIMAHQGHDTKDLYPWYNPIEGVKINFMDGAISH